MIIYYSVRGGPHPARSASDRLRILNTYDAGRESVDRQRFRIVSNGNKRSLREGELNHFPRRFGIDGTHLETDFLGRVIAVLFDDARRLLQVSFFRLLRPPVDQVAGLVELPALVVEPVRDLVPDDEPDGAVVHVPGTVAREERTL